MGLLPPPRLSDSRIVVVMGTGAGKSTFVDIATTSLDRRRIHLELPFPAQAVRVRHPYTEQSITFIDTPGFDDTLKSDTEIVTAIVKWLEETYSYEGKVNLATIVYMHPITRNRFSNSLLASLKTFTKQAMPDVIIATTMWGEENMENGQRREEELKRRLRAEMVTRGCQVQRFLNTYDSAWDIVDNAIKWDYPSLPWYTT